jgi:hypothetical protein
MKAVTMLNNGRFISDHGSGTTCYYDSRHKLIRTRLSGGGFAELIKELQPDGSYRNQFLTLCVPDGEREVIEYDLNRKTILGRRIYGRRGRRWRSIKPRTSDEHPARALCPV